MREERFFVPSIGDSLNTIVGHPKGSFVYKGIKRTVGTAMQFAGAQRLKPFHTPVEFWFYPKVVRGKSGQISKKFDCLNFGITLKIIEDWLVKFGVLKDDNRDWVYGAHCMRCELAEDGVEGILVVMREVEGAASAGAGLLGQDRHERSRPLRAGLFDR